MNNLNDKYYLKYLKYKEKYLVLKGGFSFDTLATVAKVASLGLIDPKKKAKREAAEAKINAKWEAAEAKRKAAEAAKAKIEDEREAKREAAEAERKAVMAKIKEDREAKNAEIKSKLEIEAKRKEADDANEAIENPEAALVKASKRLKQMNESLKSTERTLQYNQEVLEKFQKEVIILKQKVASAEAKYNPEKLEEAHANLKKLEKSYNPLREADYKADYSKKIREAYIAISNEKEIAKDAKDAQKSLDDKIEYVDMYTKRISENREKIKLEEAKIVAQQAFIQQLEQAVIAKEAASK